MPGIFQAGGQRMDRRVLVSQLFHQAVAPDPEALAVNDGLGPLPRSAVRTVAGV